jgi:hypothetical protein
MRLQTKILYKLGLGYAWMTRAVWRERPAIPSTRVIDDPYVFLVTSTINTSQRPLSHKAELIRSVFTPEERLNQTLATIQSVRDRVPRARIVLLENSRLSRAQRSTLDSAADRVIAFADDGDDEAAALCDGPHKGAAEAYMLLRALELFSDVDYRTIFKLSGRYLLSDRFDIERFPTDRFGFLRVGSVVSTRLYSVPANLIELYRRQLLASFRATMMGVSIEDVLARGLTSGQVQQVDPIGVCGKIAVNARAHIDE